MKRSLLVVLATLLLGSPSEAYVLAKERWPNGSTIQMNLQLSASPAPKITKLTDGSTSWNASAKRALEAWNKVLAKVQFKWVLDPSFTPEFGDGKNSTWFAYKDADGWKFDDDTLAITFMDSDRNHYLTEADVIFNAYLSWDSYSGPLKKKEDFHRVALHEYGHVLGLEHPDEFGQNVTSVMNAYIDDTDRLTNDDILGGQALYGKPSPTPTPPQEPPVLTIEKVTYKRNTGGTAGATLNPKGGNGVYYFTYGTVEGNKFNKKTSPVKYAATSKKLTIRQALTGLLPNTEYQYRLVVEQGGKKYTSASTKFRTLKPELKLKTVSNLKKDRVTLRGSINPNGAGTKYCFQYSTSSKSWKYATSTKTLSSSFKAVAVSASVTKLKKKTKYYYRLKAVVNGKTFYSPVSTFTTKA